MTWIIRKKTRDTLEPYSGPSCVVAGVTPGRHYSDPADAQRDAERLTRVNPVGFEVVAAQEQADDELLEAGQILVDYDEYQALLRARRRLRVLLSRLEGQKRGDLEWLRPVEEWAEDQKYPSTQDICDYLDNIDR